MTATKTKNSKLYLGNLSFDATEEDVRDLFGTYGEVKEIKIVTDRYTGRPRGFAFVEMATGDSASMAKTALDGQPFQGRELSIDWARAREPSQDLKPSHGDRLPRDRW